jgi:hypothetical protein
MGTKPLLARPTATSTSAGSAIPTLKKRSGKAASNMKLKSELETSADSTTTSWRARPSSTKASP